MRAGFRAQLVVAILILGSLMILTGPVFAKGKQSATLTITPNPATPYSAVEVTGCGYTVGAPTGIEVYTPTAVQFAGISVDGNGCIDTSFSVYDAGTYQVEIFQDPNTRWVMKASGSLAVQ